MAALTDIQKQIAELEKRAKELREVIPRIKADIAKYNLTAEDLFGGTSSSVKKSVKLVSAPPKTPIAPKYMDPKTGKVWNGHGKAPGWIGTNKAKRDSFLIENVTALRAAQVTEKLKQSAKKNVPTPAASSSPFAHKVAAPAATGEASPASAKTPASASAKKTAAQPKASTPPAVAPAEKKTTPVKKVAAKAKTAAKPVTTSPEKKSASKIATSASAKTGVKKPVQKKPAPAKKPVTKSANVPEAAPAVVEPEVSPASAPTTEPAAPSTVETPSS